MAIVLAIMNAKGGVGKSTTTMMLGEALAFVEQKRVLVIDADPQANASEMLLGSPRLNTAQARMLTIANVVRMGRDMNDTEACQRYIQKRASDVKGEGALDIVPGDISLAWVERDATEHGIDLEAVSGFSFVRRFSTNYDLVLIDCPPSVTRFTEMWLRSSDHMVVPMKPDFLSSTGLEHIQRLRGEASAAGASFAKHAGVVLTMRRNDSPEDNEWIAAIRKRPGYNCFDTIIDMGVDMQRAAVFDKHGRTFVQKYRSHFARLARSLTAEVKERIGL